MTNVMAGCMHCDRMMIVYLGNISKSVDVMLGLEDVCIVTKILENDDNVLGEYIKVS